MDNPSLKELASAVARLQAGFSELTRKSASMDKECRKVLAKLQPLMAETKTVKVNRKALVAAPDPDAHLGRRGVE